MKREKFIDIAKGIATILVIIGHCQYSNSKIVAWLYSFHMPLFFMINGYFIKNSVEHLSLEEFTKRKSKQILVPYLIFSIPIYISYIAKKIIKYNFISTDDAVKKFVGIFVASRGTNFDIELWFLVVLFIADILTFIILKNIFNNKKIKDKNIVIAVLSIIIYSVGLIITNVAKGYNFVWDLDIVPLCTSFILMGYILSAINKKKEIFSNKILCIIMLIINLIFAYLNYKICGKSDIYGSNLGNGLFYFVAAISGSIFTLQISKFIGKNKILETIGKHSLTYYALQGCLALPISKMICLKLFNIVNFNNDFLLCILIILLSIIILEIFSKILEKLMPKIFSKGN